METIRFPLAVHLSFVSKRGSYFSRGFADGSLHSFKVETYGLDSVKLTDANGDFAPGVGCFSFERLPAGYTWVKFKNGSILAWAKRSSDRYWTWQPHNITFEPDKFYAIKIQPADYDPNGLSDDCNIVTKDGKICPYVSRKQFKVSSETGENCNPALPRVLEAFPLPVSGIKRDYDPECWDAPTEYDSIPVITEGLPSYSFRHPTVKPVAALRLAFDAENNPVYKCSYFGPAPK